MADASGGAAQTTGHTDHEMIAIYMAKTNFAKVTYRFGRRNPPVRERVSLMNARLKSAAGEVRVVMNPRCKELVRDFEQVSYKEGSSVIDKDRDRDRTHLTDALGYLVWEEFGPKKRFGGQGRALL